MMGLCGRFRKVVCLCTYYHIRLRPSSTKLHDKVCKYHTKDRSNYPKFCQNRVTSKMSEYKLQSRAVGMLLSRCENNYNDKIEIVSFVIKAGKRLTNGVKC